MSRDVKSMSHRPLDAACACAMLALLAALPGIAAAGTPINKRTSADPNGTVEVSNVAGSVTVTGWNRNEVEVTGELGDGTEKLEFTKSEKLTRIKVDRAQAARTTSTTPTWSSRCRPAACCRSTRSAPTSSCRACAARSGCRR